VAARDLTVGRSASADRLHLLLRALEEGHGARRLTLDHLDQLPPLLAPLVQDLLKGVGDQGDRGVLPFLQTPSTSKGLPYGQAAANLLHMTWRILFESDGETLAEEAEWARSFVRRLRGLIGHPKLRPGQALIIEPGPQVHTFGMRYPIDVVFCTRSWRVVGVAHLQPWRVSRFVRDARYAIELPAGSASSRLEGGTLRVLENDSAQ
jgi:uncharacterized membrane protein (UPF0127 family)